MISFKKTDNGSIIITRDAVVHEYTDLEDIVTKTIGTDRISISNGDFHTTFLLSELDTINDVVFSGTIADAMLALADTVFAGGSGGGTPAPEFTYLDALKTNTSAAFSLSRLYSDAELCLQVRRSSDNTTLDIGFVDNAIDVAAATTFIGGGTGYISKWYDQTGNGNDAAQSDNTKQPQLVFGVQNSLPTIRFNGTSHTIETAGFLDSSFNHSLSTFMLYHKTDGNFCIAMQTEGGGFYAARDTPANYFKYNANGIDTGGHGLLFNCLKNNSQQLVLEAFSYDGAERNVYVNGVNYYNAPSAGENINVTGGIAIGGSPAALGEGNYLKGDVFTLIVMKEGVSQSQVNTVKNKLGIDFDLYKDPFIMFDGNSRTYGFGSSTGDSTYPGFSYPSQLVASLGGPVGFSFLNQAQNGASTEALISLYTDSNKYNTDGYCSKKIVVFSEIIDSLIVGDTGAQSIDVQNTYLQSYKDMGYTIVVCTCAAGQLFPLDADQQNGHGVSTNSMEPQRLIANAAMAGYLGTLYDYIIPVGESDKVGTLASTNNITYWNTDKLHNNDTGYAEIAAMVKPVIQSILNS